MGEKRGTYTILVGIPEGKRPLGRSRHRWEDNTKIYLQEIGWGHVECIDLTQERDNWPGLVKRAMNLRVP
jgi:hypothetical protein